MCKSVSWIPTDRTALVYLVAEGKRVNFKHGLFEFLEVCDSMIVSNKTFWFAFPFAKILLAYKVQVFWEGQKSLTKASSRFWRYLVMSITEGRLGQIIVAFLEYLNFTSLIYKIVLFLFFSRSKSETQEPNNTMGLKPWKNMNDPSEKLSTSCA